MVQYTGFKKKILFIAVSAALLGGCADNSQYAGYGEYFELQDRHFVERDLSAPYNVQSNQDVMRSVDPKRDQGALSRSKQMINNQYTIEENEAYLVAAQRWLKKAGFTNVDWEIDGETNASLGRRAPHALHLNGSLESAISQLGINIDHSLRLIVDKNKHIAGIHQFEKGASSVLLVHGLSMKDAIKHLVEDYGYVWGDDDSKSPSYLAPDDYRFAASYPLTTRKGDIDTALEKVLNGFPINAKILRSTKQVFIEGNR